MMAFMQRNVLSQSFVMGRDISLRIIGGLLLSIPCAVSDMKETGDIYAKRVFHLHTLLPDAHSAPLLHLWGPIHPGPLRAYADDVIFAGTLKLSARTLLSQKDSRPKRSTGYPLILQVGKCNGRWTVFADTRPTTPR